MLETLLENPIAQGIGLGGMALVVISFQRDSRRFTLLLHLGAATLFGIHFAMLGAPTGVGMNVVSATRNILFQFKERIPLLSGPPALLSIIALFWIAAGITWEAWYSLLPAIAMTLESMALFSLDTGRMRKLFLLARPGWIIYNLIQHSWAGLATETFLVISLGVALYRYDRAGAKLVSEKLNEEEKGSE